MIDLGRVGTKEKLNERRLIGLPVAAALLSLLLAGCVASQSSRREVWSTPCDSASRLSMSMSVKALGLGAGDQIGWVLFYHPTPSASLAIYDNGYSIDRYGKWGHAQAYSGWSFDGHKYYGPSAISSYAPIPSPGGYDETIFDSGAAVGEQKLKFGQLPPFMNLFIDPSRLSPSDFHRLATCLVANEGKLNDALRDLRNKAPFGDRHNIRVMKLGGLAYTPAPYSDPDYMAAVRRMMGSDQIPEFGHFLLYPGMTATGVINGHHVAIRQPVGSRVSFQVDGQVLDPNAATPANIPGATATPYELDLAGPPCPHGHGFCGKRITANVYPQADTATFIMVLTHTATGTFSEYPDQ